MVVIVVVMRRARRTGRGPSGRASDRGTGRSSASTMRRAAPRWRPPTPGARASSTGTRHDGAAEAGVLDAERPLDVGGAVPPELLVEPADVGEHLAPERHQVALDRVARARLGRLVELAQVGRDDAERTDTRRRPGPSSAVSSGPSDVAGRLDRTVQRDARSARANDAGRRCAPRPTRCPRSSHTTSTSSRRPIDRPPRRSRRRPRTGAGGPPRWPGTPRSRGRCRRATPRRPNGR